MMIKTLTDILERLAAGGGRPALLAPDSDGIRATTCEALSGDVLGLAAGLIERGVEPGDCVAVCGKTSPDWIAAALAIVRAGGVVVPVDAQMGDDAFANVLRDSAPHILFMDSGHPRPPEGMDDAPDVVLLDDRDNDAHWRRLRAKHPPEWPEAGPESDAVLFYTSGTTGEPKGVPLTHANLAFQIRTTEEAGLVSGTDRLLLSLPLHHVYPFVIGLLAPLALETPIVLPAALTGPELLKAVREGEATVMLGVPRLYRALYDGLHARAASRGRWAALALGMAEAVCTFLRHRAGIFAGRRLLGPLHRQFGALNLMACGGAQLDPDLGWRLEGLGWRVAIGYGLTETSPLLTLRKPGIGPLESVGRPVPGVDLRVQPRAGDGGAEHERGDGEIQARGPGVFRGYRNREEETRKAFTDDGWFRTGDMGHFDEDGYLILTGRVSTLIVTEGGENVWPEDVERRYDEHPFIEEIGVLEKDRKLVGLVVPSAGAAREAQDRQAAVQDAVHERSRKLPSYMRLSGVRLTRQALPRTRLGKIRRHLLAERYAEAAGEKGAAKGRPLAFDDMSDRDRALLENDAARRAWDWLRERFPDRRLSPDSQMQMDLDVDSLEWLNLTLEIRERSGADIGSDAVARIATVRDLLEEIVAAAREPGGGVDPITDPDAVLSDEQKRWLKPLGPGMHLLSQMAYWFFSGLLRLLLPRVRVDGIERVPQEGPCVLTPNHTSYLDPFVLGHVLGPRSMKHTYWAGYTGAAFHTALLRFGSRLGRGVPINPGEGAVSGLAFAAAVLARGQRLVWFPEGQRSRDGTLQQFMPGLGKVLEKRPVPVIPVWIGGTHAAWPVGRPLPRPGSAHVIFGEPVDADTLRDEGEGQDSAERIVDGLHKRVAGLGQ
jgi:long-chain acyl-CoA synthetase